MTLEVVTFGCRLNAYESEVVRARAAADGLTDAVVFNTCAVTGEAVRQARQAIRRVSRERPNTRIVVTGCAAQTTPDTFAGMAEVDVVLGNDAKTTAGAYALTPDRPRVRVGDIMSVRETAGHLIDGLTNHARAWIEVQNGCDHRCTFCVIPYGRGNSRSAPAGEVVAQVRRLVEGGVREVVLIGVDMTSWGADLPGAPTLGSLVARVLRHVPELHRLRLSSIDAAEIDDDLLRCLAEEERLAPHLHLSLQHGDDLILKRMKRRHSRAQAVALCDAVRRVRPDVAFGADLIAGFPTETEAAFQNTLALIDNCDLAFVHAFPFSPRPGTPAARMPPVHWSVVKARAARLRAEAAEALVRHLDRQVGRTVDALVEGPGVARAPDFTDIAFTGHAEAGSVARLQITHHDRRRALADSSPLSLRESVAQPSGVRSAGAEPPISSTEYFP